MEPLRCWKELFLGERALRPKKMSRLTRRRCANNAMIGNGSHLVGE
jgi:hypothetical protein